MAISASTYFPWRSQFFRCSSRILGGSWIGGGWEEGVLVEREVGLVSEAKKKWIGPKSERGVKGGRGYNRVSIESMDYNYYVFLSRIDNVLYLLFQWVGD